LVAIEVAACCDKAIAAIAEKRVQILASIVKSKFGTKMFAAAGYDIKELLSMLPDYETMVPAMHRVDDETRLKNIAELALSIGTEMPDLRMQVSLEDFQLIKKFYMKGASK
jgi:hypothetical protein